MIKVVFVMVTYHLGIVGKDKQLGEALGILLITGNQFTSYVALDPHLFLLKALFYKGINYNPHQQHYVQKWCKMIVNNTGL